MCGRMGLIEAVHSFIAETHVFLYQAFTNTEGRSPLTFSVIGIVIGIFVTEIYLTLTTAAQTPQQVVAYLFIHLPELMWPLSPFVHRGMFHFGANVFGLYILSPLESQLSRYQYVVLLFTTGFIPLYVDGAKIVLLSSKPHAAAYGASGLVFGFLGFGSVRLYSEYQQHDCLNHREWIIVLLCVVGSISVLINIITSFFQPLALKFGHIGGIISGAILGITLSRR